MKRSKIIALLVASTVLALSLFVLAGCASKASTASDGSNVVVTLPIKADSYDAWTASAGTDGVVEVKGPEAAGDEAVEYTVTPVKDGTADVEFTATKDGEEVGAQATFSFKVKDGKISETGHSEHFSGSF